MKIGIFPHRFQNKIILEDYMKIINNSDSVIIVIHEIYGINQHIHMVCEKFFNERV